MNLIKYFRNWKRARRILGERKRRQAEAESRHDQHRARMEYEARQSIERLIVFKLPHNVFDRHKSPHTK